MINNIREILIKVCKALNKHDADYLIIGGIAVGVQGYPRYTADIDLWYDPTLSNFNKILDALDEMQIDTHELRSIVFDPKKTFFRIPNLGVRIEFLPHIPGIDSFKEARITATRTKSDEVDVKVLSYENLIR